MTSRNKLKLVKVKQRIIVVCMRIQEVKIQILILAGSESGQNLSLMNLMLTLLSKLMINLI